MHNKTITSVLLSFSLFAIAACADDGTAAESPHDGFVEMSAAEAAAANVDDGAGGMSPLALADGAQAFLALDQDAHASAPEDGTASATAPCGRTITRWNAVWVPHAGQICYRGGGCVPSTFYLQEAVELETFCIGGSLTQAIHANGTRHPTSIPNTEANGFCEFPCNSMNQCEGCVAL